MLRKLTLTTAASALAVFALAGTAQAQDWSLNPTYGTVSLNSGFQPDPYYVSLRSGGNINAASLGGNCRGYIANAPDFRLNFRGSSSLPLVISVDSGADTTLVINAPDSRWYCDDDSGSGLNPSINFGNSPMSGQYDIWVGTYGNASLQNATLAISELSTY